MNLNFQNIIEQYLAQILFAITVLVIGLWKWKNILFAYKKLKLNYSPIQAFNVGIAIDANAQLNSGAYYQDIKKNLVSVIDSFGLSKLIRLSDEFHGVRSFVKSEEARQYVLKYNLDLLVWGSFSSDALKKEGENYHQVKLNFTYSHPDDNRGNLGKMLSAEVNSVLAARQFWQIVDKNSYDDVNTVSHNLVDISLYVIGLTMLLYGKLNESILIFENLFQKNKSKNDNLLKGSTLHLIDAYRILMLEFSFLKSKDFIKGIEYADKILSIEPKELSALAAKAAFLMRLGQFDKGEHCVRLLIQHHPYSTLTIVDLAYIRILKKDYKEAVGAYRRLIGKKLMFNPIEVVEFLDGQYELNSSECGFLFGSAFMNFHFADKDRAIIQFNDFILKANVNKNAYRSMLDAAARYV